MTYIENECLEYLKIKLSVKNRVSHNMIAVKFSFSDLKAEAFKLICKVFKWIAPNQLQQMDDKRMLDILKSDKVEAPEETVFVKLHEWIQ